MPPVPGYSIQNAYRPAAEVGGDFFQVIEFKSGSTLVVIGDVSGKGLRAAMIVSMIVGMLRTLTAYLEEPAEILAELNRREGAGPKAALPPAWLFNWTWAGGSPWQRRPPTPG